MKRDQIEAVARELVGDPPAPRKPKDRHWNPHRKTAPLDQPLIVTTTLHDQILEGAKTLDVEVSFRDGSIFIRPFGYGDYCSMDGAGSPAIIELAEGKLRIVAWADINQEDSTHIVELDGAREELRETSPVGDQDTDAPEGNEP